MDRNLSNPNNNMCFEWGFLCTHQCPTPTFQYCSWERAELIYKIAWNGIHLGFVLIGD